MAASNASTETHSQFDEKEKTTSPPVDEKHDLERNSTSISRGDSDDAVHTTPDDAEKQMYIVQDAASGEDDNIVWWDGDDDAENPYNWATWRKVLQSILVSSLAFITPLASCRNHFPQGEVAF